jgi:photosystem II stability/assembly factor-like uncharacterized protein
MFKITVSFVLISFSPFLFASWEAIGPFYGNVNSMCAAPSDNDIIYLGLEGVPARFWKSTDAGLSWSKVGEAIGVSPQFIAVDPFNPNILYSGVSNTMVKSTDGGATWTYLSPRGFCMDVIVHPTSSNILYVVGHADNGGTYTMTFFKSTNAGVNWSKVYLDSQSGAGYAICLDHSNPSIIYVGGESGLSPRIYKSTDGGTNFADVSTGISSGDKIMSLAAHPTNSDIIYAGAENIIYRSTSGGDSWISVTSTDGTVWRLATTSISPSYVYASCDTNVYRSTNNGATWSQITNGLEGNTFRGLIAHNTSANTVLTGNCLGVYKTTNSGDIWVASDKGITGATINAFGISPSDPSTIYTEMCHIGLFKTTDNGITWTRYVAPNACGDIWAFAVERADPNTVYAIEHLG